jgi:hypothetical protein
MNRLTIIALALVAGAAQAQSFYEPPRVRELQDYRPVEPPRQPERLPDVSIEGRQFMQERGGGGQTVYRPYRGTDTYGTKQYGTEVRIERLDGKKGR